MGLGGGTVGYEERMCWSNW